MSLVVWDVSGHALVTSFTPCAHERHNRKYLAAMAHSQKQSWDLRKGLYTTLPYYSTIAEDSSRVWYLNSIVKLIRLGVRPFHLHTPKFNMVTNNKQSSRGLWIPLGFSSEIFLSQVLTCCTMRRISFLEIHFSFNPSQGDKIRKERPQTNLVSTPIFRGTGLPSYQTFLEY